MTAQNSNALHNPIQINLIKFYHKDYFPYICVFIPDVKHRLAKMNDKACESNPRS